jgi:2-haloacid dehalogenase
VALPAVRALLFDVLGTVVDWRSSVIRAGLALSAQTGIVVDWAVFADRWRIEGYLAPIGRIVAGAEPFCEVELLLQRQFDVQAAELGFLDLAPDELAPLRSVWHHAQPWADSVDGLHRLRARFVIAPLSNGSFAMLTTMAKRAGLPWDCIISTDLFGTYKTDPATYRGAVDLLGLAPDAVMLVAAHSGDLAAAQRVGLHTAYVPRPLEWGPDAPARAAGEDSFDLTAADLGALADALDC